MTTKNGMRVIALEEHYWDPEVSTLYTSARDRSRASTITDRLHDLGEVRVKEMDDAGIDLQILSHGAPSTQRFDAEIPCRFRCGALIKVYRARKTRLGDLFAIRLLSIFTLPPAAIFPTRRFYAASWKWASTEFYSRSIGRSSKTSPVSTGWNKFRCAPRTGQKSSTATPPDFYGCSEDPVFR